MVKIHVIPSSSGKTKGTIGKSDKNYGGSCRVCFHSWICNGDIKVQRCRWPTSWRMGSGAIWRPGMTWKRMLRTMIIMHIEISSYGELLGEISGVNGVSGMQTGGPPLGNLAPPADLVESASHNFPCGPAVIH